MIVVKKVFLNTAEPGQKLLKAIANLTSAKIDNISSNLLQ